MKYRNEEVIPVFGNYGNGRIALQLQTEEGYPYCTVTKNLVDAEIPTEMHTFIDVNNCGVNMLNWLEANNFGRRTNYYARSGFCEYPAFEFDRKIVSTIK